MLKKIFFELTRPSLPASDWQNNAIADVSTPPPAWSGANSPAMPTARTQQDKLELLQWIAFIAMCIDHLGFFGPLLWGSESSWMRSIGRVSYPLFSLVFAWRLAHATWRNPRHDFMPQMFKLMACAFATQLAWELSGAHAPINPVMGFGAALAIIVLLQEDRQGYVQNIPMGVRFFLSAMIAFWVHQNVDYGSAGLVMTLAAYVSIRFADEEAKFVGILCLLFLTLGHPLHFAFFALPLVLFVMQSPWGIKSRVPGLFYWMYPAHIFALALWIQLGSTP